MVADEVLGQLRSAEESVFVKVSNICPGHSLSFLTLTLVRRWLDVYSKLIITEMY